MGIKKPNHICKNINCPHGVDGEPKHYYACDFCDRSSQWRSMACSLECYDAYVQQVIEARSAGKEINKNPIRTDLTPDEQSDLMSKPMEEVLADTKESLKDYLNNEDGEVVTIADAITQINKELDEQSKNKTVVNKENTTTKNNSFSKKKK